MQQCARFWNAAWAVTATVLTATSLFVHLEANVSLFAPYWRIFCRHLSSNVCKERVVPAIVVVLAFLPLDLANRPPNTLLLYCALRFVAYFLLGPAKCEFFAVRQHILCCDLCLQVRVQPPISTNVAFSCLRPLGIGPKEQIGGCQIQFCPAREPEITVVPTGPALVYPYREEGKRAARSCQTTNIHIS